MSRTFIVGFQCKITIASMGHTTVPLTPRLAQAWGPEWYSAARDHCRADVLEWLEENLTDYVIGEDDFDLTRDTTFNFPVTLTTEADAVAFSLVFGDLIVTP